MYFLNKHSRKPAGFLKQQFFATGRSQGEPEVMRARILRGLGVVAGASLAYYSAPSGTRTLVDEVASGAKAVVVPQEQFRQHNVASLFPRLIKPISCEESKHEVEHKVEDVLRASFDLFKSVDGLVMFFTHSASDSAGPPAGTKWRGYAIAFTDSSGVPTGRVVS